MWTGIVYGHTLFLASFISPQCGARPMSKATNNANQPSAVKNAPHEGQAQLAKLADGEGLTCYPALDSYKFWWMRYASTAKNATYTLGKIPG